MCIAVLNTVPTACSAKCAALKPHFPSLSKRAEGLWGSGGKPCFLSREWESPDPLVNSHSEWGRNLPVLSYEFSASSCYRFVTDSPVSPPSLQMQNLQIWKADCTPPCYMCKGLYRLWIFCICEYMYVDMSVYKYMGAVFECIPSQRLSVWLCAEKKEWTKVK